MTHKTYKKTIAFLAIAILLLSGVYFTLGGFGRSGPDAAPNLGEHGLVGYWNMEEGKGQTVYDRSGNSNNGTLGASTAVAKDDPVFTSGYSSAGAGGTGLKFDGKDDYIQASDSASLDVSAITIEAWIKPILGGSGEMNAIVTKKSVWSTVPGYQLYIRDNNADRLYFEYGTDVPQIQIVEVSSISWVVGQWYHVAVTYNGTTTNIYRDGVLIKTDSNGLGTIGNSPLSLQIGQEESFVDSRRNFKGTIDEVRIYNRALSADEIRQHYNQKKPILEWKFDEGSGTTTKDESFNNNDGTLHE